ncbi:hypothetical protein J6590_069033 [Homalodisca vitripennis]|nr:hypothetical protein J6590_069033 [Homalodisca vitripennis]
MNAPPHDNRISAWSSVNCLCPPDNLAPTRADCSLQYVLPVQPTAPLSELCSIQKPHHKSKHKQLRNVERKLKVDRDRDISKEGRSNTCIPIQIEKKTTTKNIVQKLMSYRKAKWKNPEKPRSSPWWLGSTSNSSKDEISGISCIDCGANDIAAGDNRSILELVKQRITARPSSARAVVSTMPHRHDLSPDHPVNQHTALANSFIEELCIRYDGNQLLDFNAIGRGWFTRHGMHLRIPGKRIMAELLIRTLMRVERDEEAGEPLTLLGTACTSSSPGDISSPIADLCHVKTAGNLSLVAPFLPTQTPPGPTTHHHCNYAEAVINNRLDYPSLLILHDRLTIAKITF